MIRNTVVNPLQLNEIGMEALSKELSPVDVARFLRLYDKGNGDYTVEREGDLGDITIDDIHSEISMLRKQ